MVDNIIRTDKYESLTSFEMRYGYDSKGQACLCLTMNGRLYVMSPKAALDIEAAFKEHNAMFNED